MWRRARIVDVRFAAAAGQRHLRQQPRSGVRLARAPVSQVDRSCQAGSAETPVHDELVDVARPADFSPGSASPVLLYGKILPKVRHYLR